MELVVISGKSGSGKSVALDALEDLGFYCVDNIPLELLVQLVEKLNENYKKVVVSIDIRNLLNNIKLQQILKSLPSFVNLKVIFLDCNKKTLVQRYSNTRRIHPLSNQDLSLESAIEYECQLMRPVMNAADEIIDTSTLSIHQLAQKIRCIVQGTANLPLKIIIESFGFKYGLPRSSDFVFDARFLANPHWIEELRPQTGLDQGVIDYLSSQEEVVDFIENTTAYIKRYLPSLKQNNRSYLTISIGCTGGQHRSVFIAEQIYKSLSQDNDNIKVYHRQLESKNI